MTQNRIDPAQLRELFEYEPETGLIYHRDRQGEMFERERTKVTQNDQQGYITVRHGLKNVRAHRLAFLLMEGHLPPDGMQIDHLNGNRKDNRWENLRAVTVVENARNRAKGRANTTGAVGVEWVPSKNRWRARIKIKGREKYLGSFKCFMAAPTLVGKPK